MFAMRPSLVTLLALGASLAALGSVGCVYEDAPPRRLAGPEETSPPEVGESAPPTGSPNAPPGAPPSAGTPSPMLVEVDTDQTMVAVGGEGVGVFIEYRSGGHWTLWWTCDSKLTNQSCDFSVNASASGPITNIDAAALPGGFVTSPSATSVAATSTTNTEVHGIKFDTAPGAVITVDAAVGGLTDGAFLFFVQDGVVNGGFEGKLSNPLQLRGTVP